MHAIVVYYLPMPVSLQGAGLRTRESSRGDFPGSFHMVHRERSSIGRPVAIAVALALAPLGLVGCRHDAPTGPGQLRIDIVAGNGQLGHLGTRLPLDLAVRVTDRNGLGVPNVPLAWRVASGGGDLLSAPGAAPVTVTDASGLAAMSLRPTSLGPIIVTASTAAVPRAATFNAFVREVPGTVIRLVPGFDCSQASTFVGPDGSKDVTVRVGTIVEWFYDAPSFGFGSCQIHLRSATVPPGGKSFDTTIGPGEHFQFLPAVAGTWTFVDAELGGGGTLTARAP